MARRSIHPDIHAAGRGRQNRTCRRGQAEGLERARNPAWRVGHGQKVAPRAVLLQVGEVEHKSSIFRRGPSIEGVSPTKRDQIGIHRVGLGSRCRSRGSAKPHPHLRAGGMGNRELPEHRGRVAFQRGDPICLVVIKRGINARSPACIAHASHLRGIAQCVVGDPYEAPLSVVPIRSPGIRDFQRSLFARIHHPVAVDIGPDIVVIPHNGHCVPARISQHPRADPFSREVVVEVG